MEQETNMFSNKGLTSSEANHICNVTKEIVKNLQASEIKLCTSSVVKDGEIYPLDEFTRIDNWVDNVRTVGNLYSLSAWLKSAIKLKEQKIDRENNKTFEEKRINNTDLLQKPSVPKMDFEDYLDTLTVKERNEYLTNEAKATHIGKFIHSFDQIRSQIENFQPTTLSQVKDEVLVVKNTRLYTKEELLEGFFQLQKDHRDAEKIVNLYKARHKDWKKLIFDDYLEACKVVEVENDRRIRELNIENEKNRLDFEKQKRENVKQISALKILIPNDLQETLDYVNTFAKN